jgi:hypothetical protein
MIHIDRKKIPSAATEGDVLVSQLTGFTIDQNETNKRNKGIQSLMNELWRK